MRERDAFKEEFSQVAPGRLHFVDETGVNVAMARGYARAQGGQRAVGAVPKNWGENVSVIGSLTLDGNIAAMMLEGSVDTDAFQAYVEQILCPTLRPGDIVLMDNLSAHKAATIEEAITACQALVRFLPPYSPELNPIEKAWSKCKTALRAAAARSRAALDQAITTALEWITSQDAVAWFRGAGYKVLLT